MDPDMVRQQEEEEAASRLRKIVTGRAPPVAPVMDDAFVLRAEPREPFKAAATAKAPAPAKSAAPAKGPASAAIRPRQQLGWGSAARVTLYGLVPTILGLVGGIALGAQLGLVHWQFFMLGIVSGFLLGWQSAVAVLRGRYELSVLQAWRASFIPALIILCSMVGGLAVILPVITGSSLETAHTSQLLIPWVISLGVGAVAGFVLAMPKMHANLRRV